MNGAFKYILFVIISITLLVCGFFLLSFFDMGKWGFYIIGYSMGWFLCVGYYELIWLRGKK